jgi:hypothetical protein
VVVSADIGTELSCEVTATNEIGDSDPEESNATDAILSNVTTLSVFTVEGQAAVDAGTVNLTGAHVGDVIGDLTIVATPTHGGATVGVKFITPSALAAGDNLLEFDVTAADGVTTQHYDVTLNVLNNLTTFTVDGVAHNDTDEIGLASGTTSVTIAATNGGSIEDLTGESGLSTGDNECTFTVVAEDGETELPVTLNMRVMTAGAAEETQIVTVADVADSLHGTHFSMEDEDGSVGVYLDAGCPEIVEIDFTGLDASDFVAGSGNERIPLLADDEGGNLYVANVDGDAGTIDPTPGGGIVVVHVDLAADDDATDIAAALALAYQGLSASLGAVTTLTGSNDGDRIDLITTGNGMVVTVTQQGHAAASPPAGFDRTIRVPYITGNNAVAVATALRSALDADAKFSASRSMDTVTATDAAVGVRTDAADVDTGFAITTTVQGVDPD